MFIFVKPHIVVLSEIMRLRKKKQRKNIKILVGTDPRSSLRQQGTEARKSGETKSCSTKKNTNINFRSARNSWKIWANLQTCLWHQDEAGKRCKATLFVRYPDFQGVPRMIASVNWGPLRVALPQELNRNKWNPRRSAPNLFAATRTLSALLGV